MHLDPPTRRLKWQQAGAEKKKRMGKGRRDGGREKGTLADAKQADLRPHFQHIRSMGMKAREKAIHFSPFHFIARSTVPRSGTVVDCPQRPPSSNDVPATRPRRGVTTSRASQSLQSLQCWREGGREGGRERELFQRLKPLQAENAVRTTAALARVRSFVRSVLSLSPLNTFSL